ncbi:MAG: cobalt-precorrin-6A reductase [Propioniciclava sp.]|uniref:cobalt-precorrin-6A reductase n=1 Tax=Propioniciclava sp. TaxID=2038686 RepID=UPI0039E53EB7
MRVLVLGGTVDGREVARALTEAGADVVTSVAGRTASARQGAPGMVTGGFGGADGLARWLAAERVDAVVDATHPFAARMSHNAAAACAQTGTPLLRFDRPGWANHPLAGTWTWADDHATAAQVAAGMAGAEGRVLLTVGRQPLEHYRALRHVLARVAEWPRDADGHGPTVPDGWTILEDRGPYAAAGERGLLAGERIAMLVTKDSGGAATAAKLDAAAELDVPVVVVRRPRGPEGVPVAHSIADAVAWVAGCARR